MHQFNCHPFQAGRFLFMHNGEIAGASWVLPTGLQLLTDLQAFAGFHRIRRSLQARLKDCWFDWLSGTTDSELLFALFLNQLPDAVSQHPPNVLADALRSVIALVVDATGGEPSSLNIAVTDGEIVLATRFRNGRGQVPPSLYYHSGSLSCESWDLATPSWAGLTHGLTEDGLMVQEGKSDTPHSSSIPLSSSFENAQHLLRRNSCDLQRSARREQAGARGSTRQSLLVSSEPLTDNSAQCEWHVFPANTLLVAAPVWRGGERDGEPATRYDLTESLPADESGDEAVVLLDVQFHSLRDLADRDSSNYRRSSSCVVPKPPRTVTAAPAEATDSTLARVSALTLDIRANAPQLQ